MTRYDVLPAEQMAMLPLLAPARDIGFVLYGGTAIGLQLGHRESIDFDFFNDRSPARDEMLSMLPVLGQGDVLQDEPNSWTVLARAPTSSGRPVKISFFSGLRFGRVGAPKLSDRGEVVIASLADLLGHKLKVLLQRIEIKDYRDIVAMLHAGRQLEDGAGAALSLFGERFPVADALRALVYFEDTQLKELSRSDRGTLTEAVSAFSKPAVVPRVSARLIGD